MPEPEQEQKRLSEQDDKYDLDRNDPFDNGHGKTKVLWHLQAIATITLPMCLVLLDAYYYFPQAYWPLPSTWEGIGSICTWSITFLFACSYDEAFPVRGFCPQSFTTRCWFGKGGLGFLFWGSLAGFSNAAKWSGRLSPFTPSYQHSNHQTTFSWGGQIMYVHSALSVLFWWAPRKYSTRSFYHRYCCEFFPHGRIFRISILSIFLGFNSYLIGNRMATLELESNERMFLVLVCPLLIFGFKRFTFIIQVPTTQDDAPFKNYTFILFAFFIMLQLNIAVAGTANQVAALADISTFIIIDWSLFLLRIGMLLRWGQKAFPAVLRLLIAKQLENVPRPMHLAVASMGDATAMRQNQAYLCLLEGITLTIAFLFTLIYVYFLAFVIPFPLGVISVFPAKDALIPIMYILSDTIQDVASDIACHKFSNWSFIFHGAFRGHYLWMSMFASFIIAKFADMTCLSLRSKNVSQKKAFFWYTNWQTQGFVALGAAHYQMQN